MNDDVLVMWVVTENPRDFPGKFVARENRIVPNADPILGKAIVADSLEELRLKLPGGLFRLNRSPGDDPVVVEVWV